jgi:hypothetical protein
LLSALLLDERGRNIGPFGAAGECAGAEIRTRYLDQDLTEGEFVGHGFEAVAVSGHQFGDGDGEVAGGLPVLYESVFDGGLRESGDRQERENGEADFSHDGHRTTSGFRSARLP